MRTENAAYLQKENKEYDENGKVIFIERHFPITHSAGNFTNTLNGITKSMNS